MNPSPPKPVFKSRTVLFNLICAAALLIPGGAEFVEANPKAVMAVITLANVIWRLVTNNAVILIPPGDADFFDDDDSSGGGGYARP